MSVSLHQFSCIYALDLLCVSVALEISVRSPFCSASAPGIHQYGSIQHVDHATECLSMGAQWFDGGLGVTSAGSSPFLSS